MLARQRSPLLLPVVRRVVGHHVAASCQLLSRSYSTPDDKGGGGKKEGLAQTIWRS